MKGKIAVGAAWVFLFRLADRSLGLISTVVLARLLVPADFGVVAMATAVIAVIELATAFGFELALVQHQNPERRHYDAAWTLNLIVGVASGALIASLAIPAAAFFDEPRITGVMLFLALTSLVGAFENVGVVDFRRRMDFVREFKYLTGRRIAGFVCTVAGAVVFESYWALLAGVLAMRLASVILSNLMQPFRPRLGLAAARELIRFSLWTLVSNAITAGLQRAPHFVVGRLFGSQPLGLYVVSADLGGLPTTELAAPVNRAAIPGYSSLGGDASALRATFLDIGGLVAMVAIPAGLGLAAVAEPTVRVLLGEKWLESVPLIQVLAISGVFVAVGSNFGAVCVALGRPRLNSGFLGFRLIVLAIALAVLVRPWGAVGAAWAELAGATASFAYAALVTRREAKFRLQDLLARWWRPVASGVVMFWVVSLALDQMLPLPAIAQLVVGVAIGAVTFGAVVVSLWWLSGRPGGTESQLWLKLMELLKRAS